MSGLNVAICGLCGGFPESSGGGGSGGKSRAVSSLSNDVGRTCFCRSSSSDIEDLLEDSEEVFEALVKKHFHGRDSIEEVMAGVRALERGNTLRATMGKRYSYIQLLREKLVAKIDQEEEFIRNNPKMEEKAPVFHEFSAGAGGEEDQRKVPVYTPAMPKSKGGSLTDWLDDMMD